MIGDILIYSFKDEDDLEESDTDSDTTSSDTDYESDQNSSIVATTSKKVPNYSNCRLGEWEQHTKV